MSDPRKMVLQVSALHAPASATIATASLTAPGSGKVIHVTEISATFAAGATGGTPVQLVLRDGATGVGTIIRQWSLASPVNGFSSVFMESIDIPMTQGNAATLEFTAAGAASTEERVNIAGYVDDVKVSRVR